MGKKKRRQFKISKRGLPPGTLVYTGDRTETSSHIVTLCYGEAQYVEQPAYAPELRNQVEGLLWVDVRSLTDTNLIEKVGNGFQMHPLALEDVLNTHQRAKLEEYDNGLFFVLHNLRLDAGTLELVSEQISLFVGHNFVVSFQEDPDDTFSSIRKRAQEGIGRMRKKGSDYLAYALIDNIVDGYYILLDEIETQVLDLEDTMFSNGADPSCKARIFDLKRLVNQFRHRIMPLRDAVTRLYRTESEIVEEANRLYLRDVVDHVAQILDSVDNQRDILDSMEALYHAESANRLNEVMRILTVISVIFMPLTFIVGIYGMNFDNMPELHWHYGYFITLGFMFVLTVGMLVYFRRKRWF
ncbi:MAG: magnesium/cobalt transporter CorA [Saprospiraceae bacterium]|nr:magnesium/cobalt transporter CorA [Saprospiraceae bacterium]